MHPQKFKQELLEHYMHLIKNVYSALLVFWEGKMLSLEKAIQMPTFFLLAKLQEKMRIFRENPLLAAQDSS